MRRARGPAGTTSGFTHRLFDERSAEAFIGEFVGCAPRAGFRTLLPPGHAGGLLPAVLRVSRRRLLCRCGRCLRWYRNRLAVRGWSAQSPAPLLRHRFWSNGEATVFLRADAYDPELDFLL